MGGSRTRVTMDLNNIKLFQAINARMTWLTERQRVLAQNVAHADTPNYVARDLPEQNFQQILRSTQDRLPMASTAGNHLKGSPSSEGLARTSEAMFEASPTGNSVVLEEEMMKVAQTAADYELMANLYRKSVGLLKLAVGKPRG